MGRDGRDGRDGSGWYMDTWIQVDTCTSACIAHTLDTQYLVLRIHSMCNTCTFAVLRPVSMDTCVSMYHPAVVIEANISSNFSAASDNVPGLH